MEFFKFFYALSPAETGTLCCDISVVVANIMMTAVLIVSGLGVTLADQMHGLPMHAVQIFQRRHYQMHTPCITICGVFVLLFVLITYGTNYTPRCVIF